MTEVDLDKLADGYLHRPPSVASLARADRAVAELGLRPDSVVVDVGGGPGDHAGRFATSGGRVVVVDPATGMWARARAQGAAVIGGRAEQLPLRDSVVDLVWFHLSIHHTDWQAALEEAQRVCRDEGELRIWTMGRRHIDRSFLARWFPSVAETDRRRFPDPEAIKEALDDLGFGQIRHGLEVEKKRWPAGEWLAAIDAGFISTVQLIPPDEFESGRRRFLQQHPDPGEAIEYDLLFDWVFATV